jgi:hypothetical protein
MSDGCKAGVQRSGESRSVTLMLWLGRARDERGLRWALPMINSSNELVVVSGP